MICQRWCNDDGGSGQNPALKILSQDPIVFKFQMRAMLFRCSTEWNHHYSCRSQHLLGFDPGEIL